MFTVTLTSNLISYVNGNFFWGEVLTEIISVSDSKSRLQIHSILFSVNYITLQLNSSF